MFFVSVQEPGVDATVEAWRLEVQGIGWAAYATLMASLSRRRWQYILAVPVEPLVVVEVYDSCYLHFGILQAPGMFPPVQPFLLDDAVHAPGYGTVSVGL